LGFLDLNKAGFKEYFLVENNWVDEMIEGRPALMSKWDLEKAIPILLRAELIMQKD